VGLPVNISARFTNTGNVAVTPLIKVKILKNSETVDEFTYNETTIKIDSHEDINTQWTARDSGVAVT